MKAYIHKTFDIDFEQTYNYYEQIGFLDVIPVGEELLGRVVNALGQPIDGKSKITW